MGESSLRLLISILLVIGCLFGTGAGVAIGSFTKGTTIAAPVNGAVVGGVVVIVTVLLNWSLPATKLDWYVPMSWFLVGLTLGTMTALFAVDGIETTFGFLITYMALTWLPLFVGFYVGTEALSSLLFTSLIALLVLLVMLVIKFSF